MRAALWLMGLFAMAVALALFAGNNQSSITWFWSPYRVDMSLNLAIVLLFLGFALVYAALRALAALLQMPHQARRWRMQQKERAMNQSLLEALSHLQAGRFVRARKAALTALSTELSLREGGAALPYGERLSATAHLIAADASHALQDAPLRDKHWQQAIDTLPIPGNTQDDEIREGAQMRAARWALDDRDAAESMRRLGELPLGAGRRTIALRIKLKAARLAGDTHIALDTARLLAKHRAFSPAASASVVRGLLLASIRDARDAAAVLAVARRRRTCHARSGHSRHRAPDRAGRRGQPSPHLAAARVGAFAGPPRPAHRSPPAQAGASDAVLPEQARWRMAGPY